MAREDTGLPRARCVCRSCYVLDSSAHEVFEATFGILLRGFPADRGNLHRLSHLCVARKRQAPAGSLRDLCGFATLGLVRP